MIWIRVCVVMLLCVVGAACAGEPVQPEPFRHAGITASWKAYANRLSFGRGQTLALVDDGCTLSKPEWSKSDGDRPKVLVTYDSVDGDNDPRHEGKGYHGTTIGIPSSVNYGGKWGVAYNNQLAVIRALECCHCNVSDDKSVSRALQWVIDHHKKYRITTVNLAPVDDKAHQKPVDGQIVGKLKSCVRWASGSVLPPAITISAPAFRGRPASRAALRLVLCGRVRTRCFLTVTQKSISSSPPPPRRHRTRLPAGR